MAYPVVTAAVLIEATGAALNNAGQDEGRHVENAIVVKQIRIGRYRYPYVSGQAWRRWWREVLYEDFGWKPSPVTREAKSAYTEGNPIAYEDDDLFGYMAARKAKGGGTFRRVSPLKNSLLISVLPNVITSDFESFSRNLPVDQPDPVPFEHEHYTTLLQGTFTLSLKDVGRFELGVMRDLPKEVSLPEEVKRVVAQEARDADVAVLPQATRAERVYQVLCALAQLRGGANLTRNNTDVTPVVVLIAFLDGGNAPLQNLFVPNDTGDAVQLNLQRLRSVLRDYKERLLKVDGGQSLFFGYRPGVLANEEEVLQALSDGKIEDVPFHIGDPGQAIRQAAEQARKLVPEVI
ncbi:MAG: type I-B CRISPR-associated protein Cas7/Cst2/DevR [Armatimonadota bacterium]|nr:MAG: type I-B CRISPR-associated protein Cas7/Cst2/DevR [Armatimonadota bacterium]